MNVSEFFNKQEVKDAIELLTVNDNHKAVAEVLANLMQDIGFIPRYYLYDGSKMQSLKEDWVRASGMELGHYMSCIKNHEDKPDYTISFVYDSKNHTIIVQPQDHQRMVKLWEEIEEQLLNDHRILIHPDDVVIYKNIK